MLSFESPSVLIAGALCLAAYATVAHFRRGLFSVPLSLGSPGFPSFKPPLGADGAVHALHALEVAGILLLALAAAGPISIKEETVWLDRGADIFFVLDASPSMSARDLGAQSRFETAKRLIRDFSSGRGADAIGLIAVGADAALLVPPTVDRRALLSRLDALRIAELGDGTALGSGLSIAALHLRYSKSARKAAVLLTDGENNAGAVHPATAASALRAVGAALWVVGIGSAGEVPIDYIDPATGKRRTGTFDSRFDADALRSVAVAGGGEFLAAPSAAALAEAFVRFSDAESLPVASRSETRVDSLRLPFLGSALGALVLARFLRRRFLGALG